MTDEIVPQAAEIAKKGKSQTGNATQSKRKTENKPQRGALLVTFKPSTPTLSAGSSFSISVTIANPFDVPVQIRSVSTLLPVDLYDVNVAARQKEQQKARKELDKLRYKMMKELGAEEPKSSTTGVKIDSEALSKLAKATLSFILPITFGGLTGSLLDAITSKAADQRISRSAFAIYSPRIESLESSEKKIYFTKNKSFDAWVAVKEMLADINNIDKQQKVQSLFAPMEEEFRRKYISPETDTIEIQPGDSITNVFVLRTRKGITFAPTSYSLDVTVQYLVDQTMHNQTIPYELDIQAAQSSVIIGAIAGSIFGIVVSEINTIFHGQWLLVLPRAITTMILSAFAVIAFARKAGVQPIIAVQDIWGGLLVGFLVGYSGTQALGNVFSDPIVRTDGTLTPTPTIVP